MKKKQLSKAALKGLAIGAMLASTTALSADNFSGGQGTYLAGNCGAGGCNGGGNRANPRNYTTDTYTPTTNSTVVNPNMAPKPESMQNNMNQSNMNQNRMNQNGQRQPNGQGSCASQGYPNGSDGRQQPNGQNGQQMGTRGYNQNQYYAPSHNCSSNISSSGQASCASGGNGRGNSYR